MSVSTSDGPNSHVHACGIVDAFDLVCWGSNGDGQTDVPVSSDGGGWAQVVTGLRFTCGIERVTRHIQCWGSNDNARIEIPEKYAYARWATVSAGSKHGCGLLEVDRTMVCWGDTDYLQIYVPPAHFDTPWLDVGCGRYHTCGLLGDGSRQMLCWGANSVRQGEVPAAYRTSAWKTISVGYRHNCGILNATDTLVCYGGDDRGSTEIPVAHLGAEWEFINSGPYGSCGILATSHQLVCWGDNWGQQIEVPEAYQALRWSRVSVGREFTCGITAEETDHQLVCWGDPVSSAPLNGCFRPNTVLNLTTGTCEWCPSNSFSEPFQSVCVSCGSMSNGSCATCAAGTFLHPTKLECSACAPGTFSSGAGARFCTLCPTQLYAVSYGSVRCESCEVGQVATTDTTFDGGAGVFLELALADLQGATQCTACPPGTVSSPSLNLCLACFSGSFAPANGSLVCEICLEGHVCDAVGLESPRPCPAGTYQAERGAVSFQACNACPIGFSSGAGAAICTTTTDPATYILLIVFASLFTLVALVVLWFRTHASPEEAKKSDYSALFLPVMSAFDFVSDIFFLRALVVETGEWSSWAYLAAGSLGVSVGVSLCVGVWVIWSEVHRQAAFAQWFRRHQFVTVLCSVLAASNLEVFTVLDCRVGQFAAVRAPWLPATKTRLLTLGLLTTALEDIPQLFVQMAVVVDSAQPVSLTTSVALATTVIMLLGSAVRRGFACFMHRQNDQLTKLRHLTTYDLHGVVATQRVAEEEEGGAETEEKMTRQTPSPTDAPRAFASSLMAMDIAVVKNPSAVADKFADVVAAMQSATPAEKQTLELYAQAVVGMARELTHARATSGTHLPSHRRLPSSFSDTCAMAQKDVAVIDDMEVARLDELVTRVLREQEKQ